MIDITIIDVQLTPVIIANVSNILIVLWIRRDIWLANLVL